MINKINELLNNKIFDLVLNILFIVYYIYLFIIIVFQYNVFELYYDLGRYLCSNILLLSKLPIYIGFILGIINIIQIIINKDKNIKKQIIRIPIYLILFLSLFFKAPFTFLWEKDPHSYTNHYYGNMFTYYTFNDEEGDCGGLDENKVDIYFYNPISKNIYFSQDGFKKHKVKIKGKKAYIDNKKYLIRKEEYSCS